MVYKNILGVNLYVCLSLEIYMEWRKVQLNEFIYFGTGIYRFVKQSSSAKNSSAGKHVLITSDKFDFEVFINFPAICGTCLLRLRTVSHTK